MSDFFRAIAYLFYVLGVLSFVQFLLGSEHSLGLNTSIVVFWGGYVLHKFASYVAEDLEDEPCQCQYCKLSFEDRRPIEFP
jgi:hypothetical protein